RSAWGPGDQDGLGDLTNLLIEQFLQEVGGLHGLFDFSRLYPGTDLEAAFMIATGSKKIALIETERNELVNKGNFSEKTVSFENGTVTQTFVADNETRVVIISGGTLDDIGSIECVELAKEVDTPSTRIFVGGPGGLAVLVGNNNVGIAGDLKIGFEGLVNGMAFKKIGDYSFVKKLVADSGFLYVLTDAKLDRIDLTDAALPAITVADIQNGPWKKITTFTDLVVSGKLAILATSSGVYRTDNSKDISSSPLNMAWKKIEQPKVTSSVQKLFAITQQGFPQDLQYGGNLEILNAYIGKNKGKISRFVVQDTSGSSVNDETIQALPDGFIKRDGELSLAYFANYGIFKNCFLSDGAFVFSSQDRDIITDPAVGLIGSRLHSGIRLASVKNVKIPLELNQASDITAVVRSSSSGDIFIATDSGLQVNE
ncbi:hypothetical protein KAH94_04400, partial [bacterium]|nr:hypothetical protein [bacterium]